MLDLAGVRERTEVGSRYLLKRGGFRLLKIHENRGFCALIEAVVGMIPVYIRDPRLSASLRKMENPALPCDERWTHYVQNGWGPPGSDHHKKTQRALGSRRGAAPSLKRINPVCARPVSCASNSNLFHMKDGLSPSHVVTALEKSWNPDGIGHDKTLSLQFWYRVIERRT